MMHDENSCAKPYSTDLIKINIIGMLLVLTHDLKDLAPSVSRGDGDANFRIKASRAAKSGINRIGAIRSPDHHNVGFRLDPCYYYYNRAIRTP